MRYIAQAESDGLAKFRDGATDTLATEPTGAGPGPGVPKSCCGAAPIGSDHAAEQRAMAIQCSGPRDPPAAARGSLDLAPMNQTLATPGCLPVAATAEQTDQTFTGQVYGVEHVDLEEDPESDLERKEEDKKLFDSMPPVKQQEHVKLQKDILQWHSFGAKLVGNIFGARQTADRFENTIAFDDEYRCWDFTVDEEGFKHMVDITLGVKMAQRSGLTVAQAATAMYTYCGKCNAGCPLGGDKVILKDRSGSTAVYWCQSCETRDYWDQRKPSFRPPSSRGLLPWTPIGPLCPPARSRRMLCTSWRWIVWATEARN